MMARRCIGIGRVWVTALACAALFVFVGGAAAQSSVQALEPAPSRAATQSIGSIEAARDALFDAQSALVLGGDMAQIAAVEAVSAARVSYARAADDFAGLEDVLDRAQAAVAAGDALALAAARGAFWTGALARSAQHALAAAEAGDAITAEGWLALREFRASTRFSRPGADATLAIRGLAAGTTAPEAAFQAARTDLYDTAQSQLNQSLADADEAGARGFSLRRAEEAGLAAGYFALLAPEYGAQRDEAALNEATAAFTALQDAAVTRDDAAFLEARTQVDGVLVGFRAAPLSDEEAARRTGQLIRFIGLVPLEYGRGVREGQGGWQVTSDLEMQEALTFREGAAAAYSDLATALSALNAANAEQIGASLDTLLAQIRATASPADVQATTDQVTRLMRETVPPAWLESNSDSDMDVIFSILDQMQAAAAQNEYALAESARIEAYAVLETGLEQRLRGFAPDLALHVESLFWQGTPEQRGIGDLLATHAPISEVRAGIGALRAALSEAQVFLGSMNTAPEAVATNAAIIVFREGLEAVVILASLLASLRTAEERPFRRSILLGGALALVATGITWWIANSILQVLLPLGERLEVIVSLIAIGVLLVITNWFFHKVYWVGWMANFHTRKRQLLGGIAVVTISQTLGLVILGFTSIYREGFETVLFLQSLVLEAGLLVVIGGVLLGLVGVAIVGAITFSLQARLPYKKMLVVTGVFIGVVLLTMVGNTVHVMQSVGWLPITPIAGVYVPYWMGQWFGLFATWQGIVLQFMAGAFVIGSYFLAERQHSTRRQKPTTSSVRQTAGKQAIARIEMPSVETVRQPERV